MRGVDAWRAANKERWSKEQQQHAAARSITQHQQRQQIEERGGRSRRKKSDSAIVSIYPQFSKLIIEMRRDAAAQRASQTDRQRLNE